MIHYEKNNRGLLVPKLKRSGEVPGRLIEGYGDEDTRLGFVAMSATLDDTTQPIFDTLARQAHNGKSVFVLPDAYARLFPSDQLALTPSRMKTARKLMDFLADIDGTDNGSAHLAYPYGNRGLRSRMPWGGRNHIKLYQFGDTVLTAGGVNACGTSFGFTDYLLEFTDHDLAEWAWRLTERLALEDNLGDYDLYYDSPYGEFIVDVGVPGQSAILDKAQELLQSDDIEKVVFSSMYRPGGAIEARLGELQEKLGESNVTVCYNSLEKPSNITDRLQSYKQRIGRKTHTASHPAEKFHHAKFIIVYKSDGSVELISTSHNFNTSGVMFGTAEIALVSSSPELANELDDFLHNYVLAPEVS